jgi:hypothetical protein
MNIAYVALASTVISRAGTQSHAQASAAKSSGSIAMAVEHDRKPIGAT